MKILVTGGAGFLGGYVMAALEAAGHEAYAYDLAPPGREILTVAPFLASRLRLGGIENIDRLVEVCRADRIEAIVHAASRVGLEPSLADPSGFYQTNIMGTVNACEAVRKLGLRKLVLISSNSAYHRARGDKLVETDPPFSVRHGNPAAHYGTSKMASEAVGMAYADFHDVDFLALRITAIYGFGMRSALQIKPMVENAVLGKSTRNDSGPIRRDYTHVQDCCSAVVAAVDAPRWPAETQRVLNASAGRLSSVAEIAEIIRRIIPGADIEIGAGLSPLEEANMKGRAALDISMAKQLLGWSPKWPIEEGIRQYADRFRSYVHSRHSSGGS